MYKRIAIAILTALTIVGCARESGQSSVKEARGAQAVTAIAAVTQDWPVSLEVQGQVAAWQEAVIGGRLTGLPLIEVLADVGDRVKRDQLLARFDDRSVKADLALARANLARATANARQATTNRDRNRALKGSGAISDQDLELTETQAETAEADRLQAQAQVMTQELRLQYCEVRAVDDGQISSRSASLGMVPGGQGGGELFRLIRKGRLEWRAELNSTQLAQVEPGQAVRLSLPDGSNASGRIRQLAPALDASTRLGTVFVDIEPGSRVRASMYVSGKIVLGTRTALVVPAESVVLRDGRASVFQLVGKEQVRQVQIEVGRRDPKFIEIVSNLKADDEVVVRGAGFLADGDKVQLTKATAAEGAR